jgi:hypothetical protein
VLLMLHLVGSLICLSSHRPQRRWMSSWMGCRKMLSMHCLLRTMLLLTPRSMLRMVPTKRLPLPKHQSLTYKCSSSPLPLLPLPMCCLAHSLRLLLLLLPCQPLPPQRLQLHSLMAT